MKELSIVVPIYNVEPYLLQCLDSINVAVSGIDSEVILVDDDGNDNSGIIAREYADNNESFFYYKIEHSGLSAARNLGVTKATGKYLTFVDSDDIVVEDIYIKMLSAAEYYNAEMIVCNVTRFKDGKWLPSAIHQIAFNKMEGPLVSIQDNPELVFDSPVNNMVFLRSFYDSLESSFSVGDTFEDIFFSIKAYYLSKRTVYINEFGYLWRIRTEGYSITQRRNYSSFIDKLKALRLMMEYADSNITQEGILKKLSYRVLMIDFDAYINEMRHLAYEESSRMLKLINEFIDKYVDMSVVSDLSLYHQQKISYVRDNDLCGLKKLMNYKKLNYYNAPIVKTDDGYYMSLPKHVFSIEERNARNEYKDYPIPELVNSVETFDTGLKLHCYLMAGRIETPQIGDLSIEAYFKNVITGHKIYLPVTYELSHYLTNAKGGIINLDDYQEYIYNYDGAGFCIEINPKKWNLNADVSGNYTLMIKYVHPIDQGLRVIRGVSQPERKKLEMYSYTNQEYDITMDVDDRQTLSMNVVKKHGDNK